MIQKGKANTFETNTKIDMLSKEKQTNFLKWLYWKIMEIKNSLEGPNSRMDTSEDRVSELEDRSIEIIQSKP